MRPGGRSGNITSRPRRFQHSRRWPNFGSITRKSTPERTLDHWKNHIDSYLTPAFGDYRLDQIDTPAIEKRRLLWRHEDKLSPIKVNKLLTTMTAIFTEAVRLFGRAISNPASTAQRLGVAQWKRPAKRPRRFGRKRSTTRKNLTGSFMLPSPGLTTNDGQSQDTSPRKCESYARSDDTLS